MEIALLKNTRILKPIDNSENLMLDRKNVLKNINNYLNNLSIKVKLLILFTLLSVMPALLIGAISYSKSSNAVETKTNKYSLQILAQTSENINQMLKSYEMICYNIAKDPEIVETINKADNKFDIDGILMIKNRLRNIIISRRDEISSVFLYSAGGKEFNEGDVLATAILNFHRSMLFNNTREANGKIVWTTSSEDTEEFRSKGFITVSRLLKDPITQKNEGSILIFLKEKTIEDMYNKYLLEKGGVIFVLDREGRVISHPDKDLLGKDIPEFKGSRVLTSESGYFRRDNGNENSLISYWTLNKEKGWKIVSIVPYANLMNETKGIRNTTILIICVCILFSIVSAYFISNKVSNPIINIAKGMSTVEKDYSEDILNKFDEDINLINVESALQIIKSVEDKALMNIKNSTSDSAHSDALKNNEVDIIGRSVASMARKIKALTEEVYKQKLLKREAELKSLQSQINPHFLYNALEKIKSIAELEGSRKSAEMIAVLGKLFRLNLNRGKDIITIKQELEHMNLYLSLQSLGKKDKYQIDLDIDEEIMECVIIKMTLQPIVENAIMHGLEQMVGRNKIMIRGYKSGEAVIIEVCDNGRGIDSETLGRLNKFISGSNDNESVSNTNFGIALRNVNERIRIYFGKGYRVCIYSDECIGTTVTINIPMILYENWGNKNEIANC